MERPPRDYCYRCRKPDLLCVCADIEPVATRFAVAVLQHPREARRTISTARIVTLSLPGSRIFVGVDFSRRPELAEYLASRPGPTYLVYPERGAVDVDELVRVERGWPDAPPTFVLIDGTWGQARKIKNQNPLLDALPRVSLRPEGPSRYLIRRQPRSGCLSTVEACVLLLARLEGSAEPFRPIMQVFEKMVARQLSFESTDPRRGERSPAPRPGKPGPTD